MNKHNLQRAIEFALDLEDNEETMAEQAAMHVTCDQYGIGVDEGYDLLVSLPDGPWWLQDTRLSATERAKLECEWEKREKEEAAE